MGHIANSLMYEFSAQDYLLGLGLSLGMAC